MGGENEDGVKDGSGSVQGHDERRNAAERPGT